MPSIEYEMKPVSWITTDAIGEPGKRVFYIQARKDDQQVTLVVEKQQVQSLAVGLEKFLEDLRERFPDIPEADADYEEEYMRLEQPIDPAFRVGQLGLGYDETSDLLVLVAREIQAEEDDPEDAAVARLWCTRSQLRALCQWGLEVSSRGRPICGNCGHPIDPQGHFCPKRNGNMH
jgi:uncharacterized repeat protein (TIGR03847 family)